MKYYTIFIDGIDKSGKDTIAKYVIELSKFRYIINGRGIISQIAYNNVYNRQYDYDLSQQSQFINICLFVDFDDWRIRCKMTNEPSINYEVNTRAFIEAVNMLKTNNLNVLTFNTSKMTAYEIALQIIEYTDRLNKEE